MNSYEIAARSVASNEELDEGTCARVIWQNRFSGLFFFCQGARVVVDFFCGLVDGAVHTIVPCKQFAQSIIGFATWPART